MMCCCRTEEEQLNKRYSAVCGAEGGGSYLQAGEEIGQLDEEGQKDEPDEADLRRRFSYFVSVHEGGHREAFELLHVALGQKRNTAVMIRTKLQETAPKNLSRLTKPHSGVKRPWVGSLFGTWLKNSCSRQSSQGSATSMGRASLEMSLTLIRIIISCKNRENGSFHDSETL